MHFKDGNTIAKHEKLILDQNVIIKNYEKELIEVTLRMEILESGKAKCEAKPIPNDGTTFQQVSVNMQRSNDDFIEDETEGTTDETKKPTDTVAHNFISTPNRSRIMTRQSNGVAFHAYMTGQKCFHNHEVFVFDVEEVDLGNGYNTQDGIYVTPVDGYYVFTWTFGSEWNAWFRSDIIVNGVSSGWITTATNNEDAASGTTIMHLNSGDHVFIRRAEGTSCTVPDTFTRSTFSGWKLF